MIERIINRLLNHEITKDEAVEDLRLIARGKVPKGAVSFTIEEMEFKVADKEAQVCLVGPYKFEDLYDTISTGDRVYVVKEY